MLVFAAASISGYDPTIAWWPESVLRQYPFGRSGRARHLRLAPVESEGAVGSARQRRSWRQRVSDRQHRVCDRRGHYLLVNSNRAGGCGGNDLCRR